MNVLTTLFPVFFMMALGAVSRIRGWITPVQKEGARSLVFGVLFPVLIFNAIFTSKLSGTTALIILYVTCAFILAYLIGKLVSKFTGDRYGHLTPYLMTTCEGGNVALPLYSTIVGAGYAINVVTFDMAGTIIAFILIPALITAKTSGSMDTKQMLKKIFTNSFVVAAGLGLLCNLSGLYGILETSALFDLYTGTVNTILAPISGVILFTLGYDLNASAEMIGPIAKAALVRIFCGALTIGGFFLLFPSLMTDPIYRTAVILYFMSPTGFALPTQPKPLVKDESEEAFMSSFISIFMIITLIVYVIVALTY